MKAKLSAAVSEAKAFLASWWSEGYNGYGADYALTSWKDSMINCLVCDYYEGNGVSYQSWSEVPALTRARVSSMGLLIQMALKRKATIHVALFMQWIFSLGSLIPILHCALTRHAIVDNSWGGPESGGIDLTCKRCGWGYSKSLY